MKTYKLFFVILLMGVLCSCDNTLPQCSPAYMGYYVTIYEDCEIWGIENPAENIEWLKDTIEYYEISHAPMLEYQKHTYSIAEMYIETNRADTLIEVYDSIPSKGVLIEMYNKSEQLQWRYCSYDENMSIEEAAALRQFYKERCEIIDTICFIDKPDWATHPPYCY